MRSGAWGRIRNFAADRHVPAYRSGVSGNPGALPPRRTSGAQENWENATLYDGRYWSRAGGNDVVVEVAVPADGYTISVYRNSKVIHSETVSASDRYVTVPLPA